MIYVIPALNLRPGMDSAANFTPRIIFSDHNVKYYTLYTYNKKAPCMGLAPMMAPISPPLWLTHSLTFNRININI